MKNRNQRIIEERLHHSSEEAADRLEREREILERSPQSALDNMSAANTIFQTEESREKLRHLLKTTKPEKHDAKGRAVESIYFWDEFLPKEEQVPLANRIVLWAYDAVRYSDKRMKESITGLPRKLCYHLQEYLPFLTEESLQMCRDIVRALKAELLVSAFVNPEEIFKYDLPRAEKREDEFAGKEVRETLAQDVKVQKHVDTHTGSCPGAEFLHLKSLREEATTDNKDYGRYGVVIVDNCKIGSLKFGHYSSFLSWVDLKDDEGRVLLQKGGLYILNKEDIEKCKAHENEVRPELHFEKIRLMPIRVAGTHSGSDVTSQEITAAIDREKLKLS